MQYVFKFRFKRTDIWREGEWLDLWSTVHFLTGILIGLALFLLYVEPVEAVVLTVLCLVAYEMWEALVHIEEAPTNRFMDVVVGMVSFVLAFFLLSPRLTQYELLLTFGLVLFTNIVLSTFGWRASQKAAALEKSLRFKYDRQRMRILERKQRLQKMFRSK